MHVVLGMLATLDIDVKPSADGIEHAVMHKQEPPLGTNGTEGQNELDGGRKRKRARTMGPKRNSSPRFL